jgi:CRP-like cAMP-binding protein
MSPTEALASLPLFRRLRPAQIARLAEASQVGLRQPGDTLLKQDEIGQALYVLLEGAARGVAAVRRAGQESPRAQSFSAGDYFGEMAVLDPAPSVWTITISQPSQVLMLTQVQLAQLLRREPEIAIAIAQAASRLARSAVAPAADQEM